MHKTDTILHLSQAQLYHQLYGVHRGAKLKAVRDGHTGLVMCQIKFCQSAVIRLTITFTYEAYPMPHKWGKGGKSQPRKINIVPLINLKGQDLSSHEKKDQNLSAHNRR